MSVFAGYGASVGRGPIAIAAGAGVAPPAAMAASFWRAHAAGWIFIALFGLVTRIAAFNDIALAVTITLILDPIGFGLTALAHKAFLARPRHRPAVIAVLVLVCSILGGLLQMTIVNAVKDTLFAGLDHGSMARADVIPAFYYTFVFLGWSLAYFWIRADVEARSERVRRSEAEAAATRAELQRLRLQLDPHFLFNALNTVAVEIPDRPDAALEMTHRIAAYLRYSLDQQTRPVCPLTDEIEAVRAYVRIQELRFEGRLRCTVELDPAARAVAVPHLIVQGLVENAVKHGLRSPAETLEVRVTARRADGDAIVIEVTNPGQLAARTEDRPAVGLGNTRRRLELHYPQRHDLSLAQEDDTVVARLVLGAGMLRVMLVDDEPPARRGFRRLLQAHPDVEVVAEAGTLAEAQDRALALRPDAIFLDVELTDGRGFDLIAQLSPVPAIVFVTAHDLYAVKAFDVSALDFLLKPVDPQRLAVTMDRLRRHRRDGAPGLERQDDVELDADPQPAGPQQTGPQQRIHLRIDGKSVIAPLGTVAMLAAEADFTRVFLKGARDYLVCRLLRHFEAQLPTPPFVRLSRSLIVNLDQLERVEWQDAGRCSLSLGGDIGPVALGRIAARRLRQCIESHRMVSA